MNINLKIPTSYSRCSLAELRAIADVMADCAARADIYHPFNMQEVRQAVFFRLTGIEVLEPVNPRVPVEEQYYKCRLRPYSLEEEERYHGLLARWRRTKAWIRTNILGYDDTFSLYLWQINFWLNPSVSMPEHEESQESPAANNPKSPTPTKNTSLIALLSQHADKVGNVSMPDADDQEDDDLPPLPELPQHPGVLDWLDPSSKDHLMIFPFESVRRHRKTFKAPAPLMDGFSWKRYRFAQDFMSNYIDMQNACLRLQRNPATPPKELKKAIRQLDLSKALFLANIFNARIAYIDEQTGQRREDFHYQSNQAYDNSKFFRNFPDRDWQLITLWWQGMMYYLAVTYPKVFKKQKMSQAPTNPLELYTRTTATMEKYIGIPARDVDREPYTVILQQISDIIQQNEETERISKEAKRKSHKKKH